MRAVERTQIDEEYLDQLLGLESSKIGFYAEVKQKIRELEATNLDLRTKKNELQAVFDAIRDGVLLFDSECRVRYRNHIVPRIFPGESLLGRTCRDLFHADRSKDPEGCPVEGALGGQTRDISFTVQRGARPRYFEATATPIEDAYGSPSRALVFLRDVTDRKVQEMHLMQVEKMSSVGVLAAGVAHEINNPLNSVAGYAEALQRRLREDPALAADPRMASFPDHLEVIVRETYRCKSIIESLLSFSRKSDGAVGAVDLGALVREVLELVRNRARFEKVEIVHDLPEGLAPARGDPAGLRQVILNLALNALQASDGPGQVRIATGEEDDTVTLRVADDGCGIAQEVLDQIWDPFFTTKTVGQGLGLGLSVTYNIVQRHGGSIAVKSREGDGTTFTVRLPSYRHPA